MPGFPKFTKEVFGLDKIDGGAFIKTDYSYFSKMNNLYLLKGKIFNEICFASIISSFNLKILNSYSLKTINQLGYYHYQ